MSQSITGVCECANPRPVVPVWEGCSTCAECGRNLPQIPSAQEQNRDKVATDAQREIARLRRQLNEGLDRLLEQITKAA